MWAMSTQTSTPGEDLLHLFLGLRISQGIYVAAELGIADLLFGGPRSAAELATLTNSHAPSLYRMLRLLASEGVFQETTDGRFDLTPMADALRRDTAGSLRPMVRLVGSETIWQSWGHLLHSIRTGEPAFGQVHGASFFEYLSHHPDEMALFDEVMTNLTAP